MELGKYQNIEIFDLKDSEWSLGNIEIFVLKNGQNFVVWFKLKFCLKLFKLWKSQYGRLEIMHLEHA